jgi:hypothetical protein
MRAKYCKCVYIHRKKSDNSIFYVGIGNKYRPYSKDRSEIWHKTVKKHGYYVELLATGLTLDLAKEIEKDLISLYGRRNLNTGCLVNLTDGGEGQVKRKMSEATKKKISDTKRKNGQSKDYYVIDKSTGIKYNSLEIACRKLNLNSHTFYAQLNGHRKRDRNNNLYYVDSSRNKAKKDTRRKKIIDINSQYIYNTIKETAIDLGIGVGTLSQHLSGFRKNENLKHLKYYE